MAEAKATALVIRGTDWSETSRIATLFTREFGKLRVLAKGGRRLKSNFEVALDLLTVCGIVVLRKSPGSLDLLTEAQFIERFPRLRSNLNALHAAYYIAELLGEGTQDGDPHPALFDAAVSTLRRLGDDTLSIAGRVLAFEWVWLRELGYEPSISDCAECGSPIRPITLTAELNFSARAGGVVCRNCRGGFDDCRVLTVAGRLGLAALGDSEPEELPPAVRHELRVLFDSVVGSLLGRRLRTPGWLRDIESGQG